MGDPLGGLLRVGDPLGDLLRVGDPLGDLLRLGDPLGDSKMVIASAILWVTRLVTYLGWVTR